MLVHLRRAAAFVAVVLVGLGLVVLDPNAPSAVAYTSVPAPPLSWMPKTTAPEVNTMSPGQWNTALNSNPNKVYSNPGVSGSAAGKVGGNVLGSGAGAGAVAVSGFLVGTDLGTEISSVIGLPTSGSFICDVGTVFGSSCALGASADYVVNSDVAGLAAAPGWVGSNKATATLTGTTWPYDYWPDATVTVEVLQAPAWHTSGQIQLRATTTGLCHDYGGTGNTPAASTGSVTVYGVQASSPTMTPYALTSATLTPSTRCSGGGLRTRTFTVGADQLIDRIEVTIGGETVGGAAYQPTTKRIWWPETAPERPAEVQSDPQRWWRTTWECSAAAPGGSRMSDPFRESDAEWPGFPSAECAAGSVVTSMLVEQITEGVTDPQVIVDWTADPGYLGWADQFPQCVGGGCELLLKRIDQVTGQRLSCFANPSLCTKWMTDPQRDQNYECSYGGTVVGLDQCAVYAPTFDAGEGSNYADPDGNVDPAPGGETDPDGPVKDEACPPPFSWSEVFNNWWLFQAVRCGVIDAGEYLFVPKKLPAQVQTLVATAQTRAPFPQIGSIFDWFDTPPPSSSHCLVFDLPFSQAADFLDDVRVLDTCDEANPVIRWLRDNRSLLTVAVWIGTLAPIGWWVWRTYAPGSTGVA